MKVRAAPKFITAASNQSIKNEKEQKNARRGQRKFTDKKLLKFSPRAIVISRGGGGGGGVQLSRIDIHNTLAGARSYLHGESP